MLESLWVVALLAVQAGTPVQKAPAPRPALSGPKPLTGTFTVNPIASVSFTATDPDTPLVAGSAMTTVSWGVTNSANDPWKLEVYSVPTSFSNCPTVPISAVTITCTGGFGGGGTVTLCSPTALSASKLTVASGTVPGAGYTSFWVTLTYTLTDKWKYIAQTSPQCTLDITYLATVN